MTVVSSATATALAVAAGLHLAALPDHAGQGAVTAAFFAATAAVQFAGAVSLVGLGRTRWLPAAIVVSNLVVLFVWLVSRTVGLPIGPHRGPEPIGIIDGFSVLAGAVAVVTALVAGSGAGAGRRGVRLAVVSAVGVAAAALGIGVAPATHTHDHPPAAATPAADVTSTPHGGGHTHP